MPRPVSLTAIRTSPWPRSVVIITVPFFPSRLSTALLTRFSITRRRTSASMVTTGSPSANFAFTELDHSSPPPPSSPSPASHLLLFFPFFLVPPHVFFYDLVLI